MPVIKRQAGLIISKQTIFPRKKRQAASRLIPIVSTSCFYLSVWIFQFDSGFVINVTFMARWKWILTCMCVVNNLIYYCFILVWHPDRRFLCGKVKETTNLELQAIPLYCKSDLYTSTVSLVKWISLQLSKSLSENEMFQSLQHLCTRKLHVAELNKLLAFLVAWS